jgi:hypothetical protein
VLKEIASSGNFLKIKTMLKFFTKLLILFIFIYLCIWIYNHINAWAGIGVFIVGILLAANNLDKILNKKDNEKN